MNLISLQLKTKKNFKKNLKYLLNCIEKCDDNSIILAPELVLSGFCYDRMEKAAKFSEKAIKKIKKISQNKTFITTFIIKKGKEYFNTAYVFSNGKIIHTQSKVKLFPLGNEEKYFKNGKKEDIKIINVNGIKIAILICFEIRFPKLWQKVLGADIILNPSMWGQSRKEHYESITKALAIINQCYVIASNSANNDMAKSSAIIAPFGNVIQNDRKNIIKENFDKSEISKLREYINIGLKGRSRY